MAGFKFNVPFKSISLAAAGTEKAIAGIKAPANQDVHVTDLDCMFTGVSGEAEPLEARFARITVDTGTPSAITAVLRDNRLAGAVQSVCRSYGTLPTITPNTDLWVGRIHPQGGVMKDTEFKDFWIARGTEAVLLVTIPTGGPAAKATGQISAEE